MSRGTLFHESEKKVFNVSSISSAATGFTLLLNWEVLGALIEAGLDVRSKEELA